MTADASVTIHSSQFPEAVRQDLLHSLRSRQVNHKFHYDSVKQTHKWLALHQVLSPSRNDPECAVVYQAAFKAAVSGCRSQLVHVIGLGCGGGQKDAELLSQLVILGKQVAYTPCDVSTAMVLVARKTALASLPEERCFPLVCDLLSTEDVPAVIKRNEPAGSARFVTFFGMIPNFEPTQVLPKLGRLIRPGDTLLFSANLAPGTDYLAGMRRILPQYDNQLTRDWLMTFLLDLGLERGNGELQFSIQEHPPGGGLQRVQADFRFACPRALEIEGQRFEFSAGETIRVFFSYRYTPALVRKWLGQYGLQVQGAWITASEEEGVFLCRQA